MMAFSYCKTVSRLSLTRTEMSRLSNRGRSAAVKYDELYALQSYILRPIILRSLCLDVCRQQLHSLCTYRGICILLRYKKLKEKRRQRKQQQALQKMGGVALVGMGLRRWRVKSSNRKNLARPGTVAKSNGGITQMRRRSLNSQVVRALRCILLSTRAQLRYRTWHVWTLAVMWPGFS